MLDVILFLRGKPLGICHLFGASLPPGAPEPILFIYSYYPKCTVSTVYCPAMPWLHWSVQAGCGGKIALLGSSVEVKPLKTQHHVSLRQGKG